MARSYSDSVEPRQRSIPLSQTHDDPNDEDEFEDVQLTPRTLARYGAVDDVPMSEMSDVCPDVDQPSPDRANHPEDQCPAVLASRKLISRPEIADADSTAFEFLVAPAKLEQRKRSFTPGRSAEDGDANSKGIDGTQAERFVNRAEATDLTKSSKNVVDDDILKHVQSHSSGNKDTAPCESEALENLENGDVAVSGKPNNSSSHNGSSSRTAVERQEKNMLALTCASADVNEEMVDGGISHDAASDALLSQSEFALENHAIGELGSKANTERKKPSELRKHKAHSLQTTMSSHHRVTKPKIALRAAQHDHILQKKSGMAVPPPDQSPSDEDLLYLLMHQVRKRQQADTKCRGRQAYLEKQNAELQNAQTNLRSKLEQITDERDRLSEDADEIRNNFDSFKEKYYKLKVWALEMNKEYAAVRQEGSDIKISLANLRQQNIASRRPVQEALASNTAGLASLTIIKQDIEQQQRSMQVMSSNLHDAHIELAEKRTQVRMLKITEEEYKSHLQQIVQSQDKQNTSSSAIQEQLSVILDAINEKIDAVSKNSVMVEDLAECLKLVKDLNSKDLVTVAGLRGTEEATLKLVEHVEVLQEAIKTKLQACAQPVSFDSVTDEILTLKQVVEHLKPDLATFHELQQANTQLTEKVSSDRAIRRFIEEAKNMAESRQAEVQKNNDKLIDSLASVREHEDKHHRQVTCDLNSQLSREITSRSRISAELKKAEDDLKECRLEVHELKQDLLESGKQNATAHTSLATQLSQQLQELENQATAKCNQVQMECDQKLRLKNNELAILTTELQVACKERETVSNKLQQSMMIEEDLCKDLEKAQTEVAQAMTKIEEQGHLQEQLLQELLEAQTVAKKVSLLNNDITTREKLIAELQVQVTQLLCAQKGSEAIEARCMAKEHEVAELNKQLCEAKNACTARDDLLHQVANLQCELQCCKEEFDGAKAELEELVGLKEVIQKKDMDLNRLQSLLEDAQNACNKLKDADRQNEKLQQQIGVLREEAISAKQNSDRVIDLESSNRHKDEIIADLEIQVSDVAQLRDKLNEAKHQLDEKETELTNRTKQTEELRTRHEQRLSQSLDSDVGLDELFTQNTNLSIGTEARPDNGATDDVSNHVCSNTADAAMNSPSRGVDPRIIMGPTPSARYKTVSTVFTTSLSQSSVVPDTQLDQAIEQHDRLCSGPEIPETNQNISSPLSDVNEDYLGSEIGVDGSQSEVEADLCEKFNHWQKDDIFEIPITSPQQSVILRASKTLTRRPSVPSQEDMLLQASETGRHSSPRALNLQHSKHGDTSSAVLQHTSRRSQDHATAGHAGHQSRRYQPRTETQTYIGSNDTTSAATNSRNVNTVSKEPNRPNSAIKRRADESTTELSRQIGSKRSKSTTNRDDIRPTSKAGLSSVVAGPSGRNDVLPIGSRSSNAVNESTLTTKKFTKRTRMGRRQSKQDRYTSQFSGSSQ